MTCFSPLQAVRIESSENPIRIVSSLQAAQLPAIYDRYRLQLPCGKCVGCRLQYSKSWAVRNMHEAQYHEMNDLPCTFVTLTYDDEYNYKNGGALNYRDVQLFLKRLRKGMKERYSDYAFSSNKDLPIRFYLCGEYGSRTLRPHYHILFYNLGFYDEKLYKVSSTGYRLYNSSSLSSFWVDPWSDTTIGFAVTGNVTFASAGYVARYCVKKALQGKSVHIFNHDTGEWLPDEFTQMSRKPGIAYEWFKLYHKSVYPDDKVIMGNGMFYKPPRYYDNLLEKMDGQLFQDIKQSRIEFASSPSQKADNSLERLIVKEKIQLKKLDLLPRIL